MSTPTIKFSGVRTDNGEYVFGNLIHYPDVKCQIITVQYDTEYGIILNMFEVHPDSVSQYTCMNDRNGEELYGSIYLDGKLTKGGDIVQGYRNGKKYDCDLYFIKYGERSFIMASYEDDTEMDCIWVYDFEVLGSLFKNPDLLK